MNDLLEKILDTAILLILWSGGTRGESGTLDLPSSNTTDPGEFISKQSLLIPNNVLAKQKVAAELTINNGANQLRSYNNAPAIPFISAFDPISVLASLAFMAFLLQSFAALFDRTRSLIPTIVNSRYANLKYDEEFADTEKRVLHALDDYASGFVNDLLNNEED